MYIRLYVRKYNEQIARKKKKDKNNTQNTKDKK